MEVKSITDAEAKLEIAAEALRLSEERAIAGQLALELMHEIKNPLEALGHLTHLTLIDAENPEKVKKYMRLATEQMATVSEIAGQTLGFARSSQQPRPMDLVALAEAALRIHQRRIEQNKVRLVKELPESAVAKVYTSGMLQVLSNLIVNALDALPEQGTLCLRLKKRGGQVQFLIADNGHGIAREHCDKVFEPFFTTKKDSGTGLGLALTRKIVERHRGRISMRSSVRPGKSGTLFRISLPA